MISMVRPCVTLERDLLNDNSGPRLDRQVFRRLIHPTTLCVIEHIM